MIVWGFVCLFLCGSLVVDGDDDDDGDGDGDGKEDENRENHIEAIINTHQKDPTLYGTSYGCFSNI